MSTCKVSVSPRHQSVIPQEPAQYSVTETSLLLTGSHLNILGRVATLSQGSALLLDPSK
jgi:hypothetical protein